MWVRCYFKNRRSLEITHTVPLIWLFFPSLRELCFYPVVLLCHCTLGMDKLHRMSSPCIAQTEFTNDNCIFLDISFKKRFFVPRTWSGCYHQISDFFSIPKIWCCLGFYIDLPGVVIHPSSFTWINHYELLSCWVESTHPFAAIDVDVVLLQLSGAHNCLTRCLLQMFLKPWFVWSTGIEPVNTSLDTNPVTGWGQVCLTSVI